MSVITEGVLARALDDLRASHDLTSFELNAETDNLILPETFGPDARAHLSVREIVAAINAALV